MQDDLIIRHLTGETSAEEEKQMHAWLAQLPENEKHYLEVKKILELGSRHYAQSSKGRPDINIDKEWSRFVSAISEKKVPVRAIVPENSSRLWLRIAAALLLLFVSGFIINYFVFNNTEIQFQSGNSTLPVVLSDGSKIILNKNSRLSYASNFGEKDRRVTLKGEAFFDVERNTLKPFVIAVNQAEVEVLGTSFNVQGYDDRKEIEVIVQTGVVRFSVQQENRDVELMAGQKGVYSKAARKLISGVNEDLNFLSWNTRKIVFVENDLRSVVETLNETYQVNIILPATIPATCVVTVTFDHQTLESVLNVLKTTLNLTYKINGSQIEIVAAGC
jgi:ferric-dicitrate binding protein FerR (iron transport regulator)